jgi:glycosyltransferase involved in cell wall biosynthesis
MGKDGEIRVRHLISGDLWAGAEVQAFTLIRALSAVADMDVSAVILNEGKLAEKLRDGGIEVSIIDERIHNFFKIKGILAHLLKGGKIDILHTHRYKENVLGGLVKNRCEIKGLIQTVHGMQESFRGLKQLKMKFYTNLSDDLTRRRFSKVIAVSQDIAERLRGKFGDQKVVTVHNAIDTGLIKVSKSAEEIKSELGISGDRAVIGSAGRLVPVKGYDIFLKAAKLILRKRPKTVFVIAGDGPLNEELREMASSLGIGTDVIFTGFRDDVPDLVNAFDIFLVTSVHEGIPMSVLEAMAMRKVVVSTAVGGIPEIIEDNISGILTDPGSPDGLAERCLSVLEDHELRDKIERNAERRVGQEFSTERLRDQVLRLYEEMI